MRFGYLFILLILVVCPGYANEVNLRNAEKYFQSGEAATRRGDWNAAREAYFRAAANSDLGRAPDLTRSVMYYEYGRSAGATCFFELSEGFLLKSLKLNAANSVPTYYPLIELARLNLDQRNFEKAVPYFERALSVVENVDAESKDPIGFADLLEEYAQVLTMSGKDADASLLKTRATTIRAKHPGVTSKMDRTPYGKHCAKKE